MFELKNLSRFISALNLIPGIIRISLSGLFRPSEYSKLVPGLKGNSLKAYVHIIRHGAKSSKFMSNDPVEAWLLPDILNARISSSHARQLKNNIEDGDHFDIPQDLTTIANFSEYFATRAYLKGDFNLSLEFLKESGPNFTLRFCHLMLRGPYHLDDMLPYIEKVERAFEAGIWDNDLYALKMYRDICISLGVNSTTVANISQQLTDLATKRRRSSDFYLGFQETQYAPNLAAAKKMYGEYAILQDVAAKNARRSKGFLTLKKIETGWELSLVENSRPIGVFIPPPEIWINAAPFARTVISSFKAILDLLDNEAVLVPLLFPHSRDVSRMALPTDRMISYHTFGTNPARFLHFKESNLRGLCVFDPAGYSGAAQTSREVSPNASTTTLQSPEVAFYKNIHETGKLSKYQPSKDEEQNSLPLSIRSKKYILIALQIMDDSAARWQKMEALEMIEICCKSLDSEDFQIVIRPHPKNTSTDIFNEIAILREKYKNLSVVESALVPLLKNAQALVTANSGLGIEALLYGVPVITTGESEYRPASLYAPDEKRLQAALKSLKIDTTTPLSFAWINDLFSRHLWNGSSPLNKEHEISKFIDSI